eukprot:TRINITY_DN2857_c0_g1_i4.p1 TRINITY_DN2857_c0_g1~~TRINITY_DN2857_c0_g1_i4.p1  ORF type:complete len:1284 (+),score=195.02 TRINITY_DN2857_c0_g1_i4:92-3943(+)
MSKSVTIDVVSRLVATKGDIPTQRYGHTAVLYKGHMYVYGGIDRSKAYDPKIYGFNMETNEWSVTPVLGFVPQGRMGHSAVIYGDSMLIFGGCEYDRRVSNSLYEFSFETFSWKELKTFGEIPAPRYHHAAAIYKEYMFVVGGSGDLIKPVALAKIFRYHFVSKEWKLIGTLPKPVAEHTISIIDDNMYVFGGLGTGFALLGGCTHKVQRYNLVRGDWTDVEAPSHPNARKGHSSITYNNWFYIFGGDGAIRYYNDMYAYTHPMNDWKRITLTGRESDIPHPRGSHSAVLYKGKMYIFGGDYGVAQKQFNDLFEITLGPEFPTRGDTHGHGHISQDGRIASRHTVAANPSESLLDPSVFAMPTPRNIDSSDPIVEETQQSQKRHSTYMLLHNRRKSLQLSVMAYEAGAVEAPSQQPTQEEKAHKKVINFKVMNEKWLLQYFQFIFKEIGSTSPITETFLAEKFKTTTDIRWKKAFKDKHGEISEFLGKHPHLYCIDRQDDNVIIAPLFSLEDISQAKRPSMNPSDNQERFDETSSTKISENPKEPVNASQNDSKKDSIETDVIDIDYGGIIYDPLLEELVNVFIGLYDEHSADDQILTVVLSTKFSEITGTKWLSTYGPTYGALPEFLGNQKPLFSVAQNEDGTRHAILHREEIGPWRLKMKHLRDEQEAILEKEKEEIRRKEEKEKQSRLIQKRKNIIRELYLTESSYVNNMRFTVEKHMVALRRLLANGKKILLEEEIKSIFSLIESIFKLHSEIILPELAKVIETLTPSSKVSYVIIQVKHYLKMYSGYADNFDNALETYKRCSTNPMYANFLKECLKDPQSHNLDLPSLLIQPVQRLPRYKLLLDELAKITPQDHPDYEDLQEARNIIQKTTHYTNAQVRTANMREKLAKIDGFEKLFLPTRHYVYEASGTLTEGPKCETNLGPSMIILFSDIFIVVVGRTIYKQIDIKHLWWCENENTEQQSISIKSPDCNLSFEFAVFDAKLQMCSHLNEKSLEYQLTESRSLEFKYADLGEYKGTFLNAKRHGNGIMKYYDGSEYDGDWHHDLRHGRGFSTKKIGIEFEFYNGEWENDKPNGKGTIVYPSGNQVDGLFEDGKPVGMVTEITSEGMKYTGGWSNGCKHGQGTAVYPKGSYYEGNWVQGLRHGKGKYTNEEKGKCYEGEWKNDKKDGHGTYRWDGGRCTYVGNWVAGKKHGPGFMIYANGDRYDGEWEADQRHGFGIFTDAALGRLYEGPFVRNRKEGKGLMRFENGDSMTATWAAGLLAGPVDFSFSAKSGWANPDL